MAIATKPQTLLDGEIPLDQRTHQFVRDWDPPPACPAVDVRHARDRMRLDHFAASFADRSRVGQESFQTLRPRAGIYTAIQRVPFWGRTRVACRRSSQASFNRA